MEQLSLDLMEAEEILVYGEILRLVQAANLHSDILSLKPLKADGEATLLVENKPMCKIAIKAKSKYIVVRYRLLKLVTEEGLNHKVMVSNNSVSFIRLLFNTLEDIRSMKKVLLEAFEIAYLENTDRTYGCCHRFTACSDERKCIHPDHLFALGCMYRKNLEAGRIFYGKNQTL